jgi:hypothetical protein
MSKFSYVSSQLHRRQRTFLCAQRIADFVLGSSLIMNAIIQSLRSAKEWTLRRYVQ